MPNIYIIRLLEETGKNIRNNGWKTFKLKTQKTKKNYIPTDPRTSCNLEHKMYEKTVSSIS